MKKFRDLLKKENKQPNIHCVRCLLGNGFLQNTTELETKKSFSEIDDKGLDNGLKGNGKFFWCDQEQFKVHARGCNFLQEQKMQKTISCPDNNSEAIETIVNCPLVSDKN